MLNTECDIIEKNFSICFINCMNTNGEASMLQKTESKIRKTQRKQERVDIQKQVKNFLILHELSQSKNRFLT